MHQAGKSQCTAKYIVVHRATGYLVLLCSAPSWETSMHCRVVVYQATGYLVLLCITLSMVHTVHPPITYLNAQ